MTRRMELREAIEVYVSQSGNICIKQESPLGEEDQIVALEPEQVPKVVKWLYECLEESGYPKPDIKPRNEHQD